MIFGWFRKPGQVEHDFCQDNLSAYVDGMASAREKARVERHLSECSDCRQTLSELRAMVAMLRQTPALKVPRSFALPQSVGVRQTEPRVFRLNPGYLRLAASVATAVLVLVVSGDLLLRSGFLGSRQSNAPAPVASQRDGESNLFGTAVESATEPTSDGAAPRLMAPAPVANGTASDTQLTTEDATGSVTSAPEATPETQALLQQTMPSETFARPAGAPPLPTSTPGEAVPPPVAAEKSAITTAVPTVEPTTTPTPTPTATPTPEPTVTPGSIGRITSRGTVMPASLVQERSDPAGDEAPLSSDSSERRETILALFRWLELGLGGLAVVLLSMNLWLRLTRQPA